MFFVNFGIASFVTVLELSRGEDWRRLSLRLYTTSAVQLPKARSGNCFENGEIVAYSLRPKKKPTKVVPYYLCKKKNYGEYV